MATLEAPAPRSASTPATRLSHTLHVMPAAAPAVPGAKLAPALPTLALVDRPGLRARLAAPHAGGVSLLRAPSGFGKTTLLQACRQQLAAAGTAAAWLNLDASDNDAQRLLHCLGEACGRALSRGAGAHKPLVDPGLSAAECADRLFTALEQAPRPFALFLDDFEALHDAAALGWIAALMDRLPPQARLFIASRRVPDLPLSRLRTRGSLRELDAAALRFSLQEAEDLLNVQRRLGLHQRDVASLHQRTEGWVAGLSLAALALEHSEQRAGFIQQFSGCYATVSEYLSECVLSHQPEPTRRFLLHTSVLESFDAELCHALMPDIDARAMLDQLRSADVLLMPLDGSSRSFRYHSMFARFLQNMLHTESPALHTQMHCRAAAWYAAQQRPVPAINHALQGGDTGLAISLLRANAHGLLVQGRTRLLDRWLSALPPSVMQQETWLQAMHVWAATYTHGAEAAAALLDRHGLAYCDEPRVQDSIRPLKPVLLAMMDRVDESVAVGLECIEQREVLRGFADGVLLCSVACVLVNLGDFQRGRALLDQARRIETVAQSGFTVMHCEVAESIIDAQQGRLRQACSRLRVAVEASRQGASTQSIGNAWAGVLHACACYETGDVVLAERLLRAHAPAVQATGMADMMILVYRSLARIAFRRGDVDDAYAALTELQYLGHRRRLDRVVASAGLERSRLLLEQGHADAAHQEIERAGDDALWQRVASARLVANEMEDRDIARWRWQLHAGNAGEAVDALRCAIDEALSQGRQLRACKLRLLHALALARAGQANGVAALGSLLHDTCAEQFVQLYADEGRLAHGLLTTYMQSASGQRAAANPGFASYLQRLLQAFGPRGIEQVHSPAGMVAALTEPLTTSLAEPLTRRELAVLQLVADGMADAAMADKLFLSMSTVRTHLRSIYSKLGVHSRMQAVLAARRAGAL